MPPDDIDRDYALTGAGQVPLMAPPDLPYRPGKPRTNPEIGLIGCGGISEHHLSAYRRAGFRVSALCDLDRNKAEKRRKQFFPEASVHTDYREVLEKPKIAVIDVATHPPERISMIEDGLRSGKHVLSQKPFVTDLDEGERLVKLAEECGVFLAVNQNGRWAPHFRYVDLLIREGWLGKLSTVDFSLQWDHNWTAGTPFDNVRHLLLFDFCIHWFDIIRVFFDREEPVSVFASIARSPSQLASPALLGHVVVDFQCGQATIALNGDCRFGPEDRTTLVGSRGTVRSGGPDLNHQTVHLVTEEGRCRVDLEGAWFPDGFQGTMAELLCAIEDGKEPGHSARNNLESLSLCFAAVASAETGTPRKPGEIRSISF